MAAGCFSTWPLRLRLPDLRCYRKPILGRSPILVSLSNPGVFSMVGAAIGKRFAGKPPPRFAFIIRDDRPLAINIPAKPWSVITRYLVAL